MPHSVLSMECLEFLEGVVTQLTGQKPEIAVDEDQHGAVINMKIGGNIPTLIGKKGANIDAIRTIIKALGYNGKHRIKLRIYEPAHPQPSS